MSRPLAAAGAAVIASVVLLPPTAFPQSSMATGPEAGQGARLFRVGGVGDVPAIDGRLDDAAWRAVPPLSQLVQREPREGTPVSERTDVRVLVGDDALYVGAWLYDRTPDQIVAGERLRDAELTNSDYFAFILDTYFDRQNGFVFGTTPAGIEYDGQVIREGEGGGVRQQGQGRAAGGALGGFNLNWDASWQVMTSRDAQGWYAEFRIPFSTLRYSGGGQQAWGANFVRGIRRHNEEAFWAPIPRQYNLYRLSRAGTLAGVPVPTRRTLALTPYALASARRDYLTEAEFNYPREVGADAKIGVTSSLTLDLTYNTDFAQVEVDDQQTNLTRFQLFFPEKRPFFLENGGTFSAGTPQAIDLFFSRRIGISRAGQPVPILGGGRLTGKVGGLTVGALEIVTDDALDATGAQVGNSYTVGRVLRELPNRSRLGAIFVQRMAVDDAGDRNRTYGVDGRIGVGDVVTVDLWAASTETPGRTGRNEAANIRANHLTRDWNSYVRFTQVGEDFNPEVGFLSRSAYRLLEGQVMRYIRVPSKPWIRQLDPHITARRFWDFAGFVETGYIHVDAEMQFSGGGRVGPEFNFSREGLRAPYTIAPGVVIPPGTYRWFSNGWDVSSNPSAPLSVSGRLDLGEFWTGHRWGGNMTVTLRRGASLTTSVQLNQNFVRLPQGDFETTVLNLRGGYFFTPKVYLQSLLQYSNQAQMWSANVRFAVLNTAGTGLFIVFNEAQNATDLTNLVQVRGRSLVVKYTRQFNVVGF